MGYEERYKSLNHCDRMHFLQQNETEIMSNTSILY